MPDEHELHPESVNTRLALLEAYRIADDRLYAERWDAHAKVHQSEDRVRNDTKEEMNRRLETMNGLKAEMVASNATYITRTEHDTANKALSEQIGSIARLVYIGLGIVLLAAAVIGWLLQHAGGK